MTDTEPRRNIELKARVRSLDETREVAARLSDQQLDEQHQIDTYFHCEHGRLKLREIVGVHAELISYDRPDDQASRGSSYHLVPVDDPVLLKTALGERLGVRKVVEKRREIYLWRNVRLHLDTVTNLGAFLEFEAVLAETDSDDSGHALLQQLRAEFGIRDADLIAGSYGDM